MEFQYRAGDERSPSATSANSETAEATRVHDGLVGLGGDGAGCHGENSPAPPPPASSDPDELRRRATKEMIRARILRQEAEYKALEAEVRHELMEERASSLALLSETMAAPMTAPIGHEAGSMLEKRKNPHVDAASAVSAAAATSSKKQKPDLTCTVCKITATSALALQEHLSGKSHGKKACNPVQPLPGAARPEVDLLGSKVNGSAGLLAKGGNPGVGVTSSAFALTSRGNLDLNCTVCGITATSQKMMQDHLKGKNHMRKTAMLEHPLPKEDRVCSEQNASAAVLPGKRKNSDDVAASSTLLAGPSSRIQKQDLTPMVAGAPDEGAEVEGGAGDEEAEVEGEYKFKMATNSGRMCEVVQLNGSILCEVCNVRTADRVTMMCHLEGTKHTSKQAKQQAQTGEPLAAVAGAGDGSGSGMVADGVHRVDGGYLLCELCNVKAPSECTMRSHLSGRKHINKQKASVEAAGAGLGKGSGSEAVSMEANGVRRLDGGVLQCDLCDVKAPSECVMQSHLSGKKHLSEMKKAAAAAIIGSSSKEAASIVVNGSDKKPAAGEMEVVVPSATLQVDGGAPALVSVAPMEVDEHAAGARAEQEKADAEHSAGGQEVKNADAVATIGGSSMEAASTVIDGSDVSVEEPAAGEMQTMEVTAREMEAMEVDEQAEAGDGTAEAGEQEIADAKEEEAIKMDGVAAVTGQEVKFQVQGMPFIALRQADGSLSCGLCGEHGYDKDGMVEHLYTMGHWRRARLAEEKKQASKEAPEAKTNAGGNGVLITDGVAVEAMSNACDDSVLVTDEAAAEVMSNAGGDGVLVTDEAAAEVMSNAGGNGVLVTDDAAAEATSNAGGNDILVIDGAAPEAMTNAGGNGVLVTDGAAAERMSNACHDGVLVTDEAAAEAMSNAEAAVEAMSNAGVLVTDAQVDDNRA